MFLLLFTLFFVSLCLLFAFVFALFKSLPHFACDCCLFSFLFLKKPETLFLYSSNFQFRFGTQIQFLFSLGEILLLLSALGNHLLLQHQSADILIFLLLHTSSLFLS
ncbi:hypothetical protein RchiOBHm_Chr7g0194891 [Rosa chinensis]|uniref:Uncharacterized protein n=1 Tax=Rosa chinensis TaxID=74649 RepID=A0A2P6P686_ROSCH|nr:hypothetical protein RchiOBHm_Chr7g0194891 [Rosa chinensis]